MKIQISGPTEVTGDNARYTVDLSELTPGSYTLVAGAWNDTSSILGHLNFTTKPIPTGPDASYYTQAPTLLSGYYVRHVVNDIAGIPHGEPQRDQAQTRGMRYQPRQFAAGGCSGGGVAHLAGAPGRALLPHRALHAGLVGHARGRALPVFLALRAGCGDQVVKR